MKLAIATTAFALTAFTAFAQDTASADMEIPEFVKPEIAFVDAVNIVNANGDGDIIGMELDFISEDQPVYVADIEEELGFSRLLVSGTNGDVLASETITAADEEALDAYMEHFSTQAEVAEMMMLSEMILGDDLDFIEMDDLDEEELEELLKLAEDEGFFDDAHDDQAEDIESDTSEN